MSEAPRDGTVIMARRRPNMARPHMTKHWDIRIRWWKTCWLNQSSAGNWLGDHHLEGWWPLDAGDKAEDAA